MVSVLVVKELDLLVSVLKLNIKLMLFIVFFSIYNRTNKTLDKIMHDQLNDSL